ncbi:MAG TPA: hypothetical protein VFE93_10445 [Myxococcaceae bacterium]|nr:hypothetical protein [Myxococcaceae bacterium]
MTGWLCEVCGKQVGPSPASANLTAPLDGIEPTQLPPGGLGGIDIEPVPALESTATSPVPEVPGEPLLGWEMTHVDPGADVQAGGLPDLDPGRAPPEGTPAVAPSALTCRYCRNVQTSGLFCDRCGMRLPWAATASAVKAEVGASTERRVCKRCGERSPASMARCGACGALLVAEP